MGLLHLCRTLDELERLRIRLGNRTEVLTRSVSQVDKDGTARGFGLSQDDPTVLALSILSEQIAALEKSLVRNLEKSLRKHPLGPWVESQKGIGYKQTGRLLGEIGDPAWNDLYDRPRTLPELWAFCGLAPGQRKRKGVPLNWNPEAKARIWNIVQSILRQPDSEWRTEWDLAREKYRGTAERDAHEKARTDRYVAKKILRSLWQEARRLHELSTEEPDALRLVNRSESEHQDSRLTGVAGPTQ